MCWSFPQVWPGCWTSGCNCTSAFCCILTTLFLPCNQGPRKRSPCNLKEKVNEIEARHSRCVAAESLCCLQLTKPGACRPSEETPCLLLSLYFCPGCCRMIYFAEFVWPDDTFVPYGTCLLTWMHCCKLCTVGWGLWPEVNSCRNEAGIEMHSSCILVLKHCVERGRDASSLLLKCCVAIITFGGRWTRPSNVFSVWCRYFQCYLSSEETERKKKTNEDEDCLAYIKAFQTCQSKGGIY